MGVSVHVRADVAVIVNPDSPVEALSRAEIASILCHPTACKLIDAVGVDVAGLGEIADFHLCNQKDQLDL